MNLKFRIIRNSILAILIVIAINLIVLASLNFPSMALFQLKRYIWLLILLVLGFGVQIGLFTYLKHKSIVCSVTTMAGGGVSAISMILCCSHYLINILPFISLSFASFLTRYTFWILMFGIVSNIAGILFMLYKIASMKKKIKKRSGQK
ncbi:hypothetical protein HYT26_02550 [Candidatus Pacearchaeota archaeon]|nr:hypothetical protein [Candidatus Pacearchaeota archaeon]